MAPELKSKKRKAADAEEKVEVAKKEKKVVADAPAKKRKTTEDKPEKKAKAAEPAPSPKAKAAKKADKPESVHKKKLRELKNAPDAEIAEKKKKAAKEEKAKKAAELVVEEQPEPEADSDVEMEDDQTEALLKGFESDGDDDEEKNPEDKVYSGEEIPEITTKAKKKLAKLAEKKQIASEPGTVYLGRIPHGFYENEMKQYFKQFGDILNLRLSRNKKTGKSKHYAFIQFNSGEVAEIVSKTMDNYLLFGHILKCKVVPKEQVHDSLWEGANKRFKKVPWNKMEGRKLKQGATEETWDKRAKKEEKRRAAKQEKLKAIGYDFAAPDLKSAKDVQRAASQQLIVEAEVAEEKEPTPEPPKKVEAPKVKAAKAEKPKRKADEVETEEPSKKKVKAKGSSADLKAAAAAKPTAKVEKAEKKAEKPAKKAKKSKA